MRRLKRLMKYLALALVSLTVLLVATFVLWRLSRGVSTSPDQLTLYSINHEMNTRHLPPDQEPPPGEYLHGYLVLGKLDVNIASERKQIMAALNKGMTRSDGMSNKCFEPRHAIRTVENGKIVDYMICFHCRLIYIHGGESMRSESTTSDPQAFFNKFLTDAGISLASDDEHGSK